MQEPGTLNFYHPHFTAFPRTILAGLVGALVVNDSTPPYRHTKQYYDFEESLFPGKSSPHSMMMDYMHGKEGNIIMVNGKVNLACTQKQAGPRWRILNAATPVSTGSHWMAIPEPYWHRRRSSRQTYPRSEIILSPGERVDILVKRRKARAATNSRHCLIHGWYSGQQTIT